MGIKVLLNDGRKVIQFAFEATRFDRNLFAIVACYGNCLWCVS